MSLWDVFLILFLILALQPAFRQRLLRSSRSRLISKIEEQRGSRVISLVHRQETMSFLGFPLLRYIDIQDSEEVLRAIHLTDPKMPIDLILQTPGGLALASLQIARALHEHEGKVTVFVPHYAMSGGTLIALAADEIVMSEHAVLGPVDPVVGQFPAISILRVLEQKSIDEVDDETIIMADQADKAISQLRKSARDLVDGVLEPEKVDELISKMVEGHWTHDFPITCDEARALGLPISCAMPEEIVTLMSLYAQPVRRTPSVQYVPGERRLPGNSRPTPPRRPM